MPSKKRITSRQKAPKQTTGAKKLSKSQITSIFRAQREAAHNQRLNAKATKARNIFRPRKADRGKIVMVSVGGKRNPQAKGRVGYPVYVTKGGKKRLIREAGRAGPIRARKISDIELPARKNLKNAVKEFQSSRRVMVSKHRAALKGEGRVNPSGAYDFSDAVVKKIARSIKKAIEGQAARRSFLITANVLVQLPDGSDKVYQVQVPIARPDHIAIRLGGLVNFVRLKFYAFMAKELAYDGYVSSGSANHIRHLAVNYGIHKSRWSNKDGEDWRGQESEIVKILQIEWKIEQIK